MFTGIVEEVGTVLRVTPGRQAATLRIKARTVTQGLALGDSVAVNGACLTVVAHDAAAFSVEAVHETLDRTTTGALGPGSRVNLERALAVNGRLGGHIVSGHVDGIGRVERVESDGDAVIYAIAADARVMRYVVDKGSIAVDGISLTVARTTDSGFTLSVIPHTAGATTLSDRRVGDRVNLETDVIGRYVEKLMRLGPAGGGGAGDAASAGGAKGGTGASTGVGASAGVDAGFLARCGFL